MSDNVKSADNQQATPRIVGKSSETTRRAPLKREILQAYLQGALHDGTFSSNKRFRFSQKGTGWLLILKQCLVDIGFTSWIYREGRNRDVFVLETLARFLDFKFDPRRLSTRDAKASYIRGFFDAEGGIPHKTEDRFYIQLVQKNRAKLERLKELLADLYIETGTIHNPSKRVDPNYWRMYVRADSHDRFVQRIDSWHPRKRAILVQRMMI